MAKIKPSSSLIKIGLTVFIALLMFYFGFNFLKGLNLFDKSTTYYIVFNNTKDLMISTPVTIDGYKVGLVRSISFDYKHLTGTTVEVALDDQLRIPVGSRVTIKGNPLTGAELAILKSKETRYYNPNDTLPSFTNNDLISQVADDIIPSMVKMIGKMDTLVMGLDRIVNNEHIFNTFNEINQASSNIRMATEAFNKSVLTSLPDIVSSVRHTAQQVNIFTDKLSAVNLDRIESHFDNTLNSLDSLTVKLNKNDNTMGLLLNDQELYVDLHKSVNSADSLLIDLRKNPKRYVHFSIF